MDTQGGGASGCKEDGITCQEQSKADEGKDRGGRLMAVRLRDRCPGGGVSSVGLNLGEDTTPGQTEDDLLLAVSSLGLTRPIWEMLYAQERLRRSWGQRQGFWGCTKRRTKVLSIPARDRLVIPCVPQPNIVQVAH